MKKILIIVFIFILGNIAFAEKMINLQYDNGIYHIILAKRAIKKINFVSSEKLITNKEAHNIYNSELTINTGFFDPKNGKTISYIVTDGKITENPLLNTRLTQNPELSKNLNKILNRSELRILSCNGKLKYSISSHYTPIDNSCKLVTSAQGGPQLLPELRLEEEFFIVKNESGKIIRESASVLERVPRTIVGIKNNRLHILIITNKNAKTIYEVRDLCKNLGFDSAMAFDGGSSTSLNYKNINVTSIEKLDTGRKLKSFMIFK